MEEDCANKPLIENMIKSVSTILNSFIFVLLFNGFGYDDERLMFKIEIDFIQLMDKDNFLVIRK